MGTVRSLRPTEGLESFCDFLYGKESGYVHVPVKDPESGDYEYNHFFKWPSQRSDLIKHVETQSHAKEVFITPGMFKTESANVQDSHGSYVAWVDFDGNTPSPSELEEANIPLPTLCVQSSVTGREHWYWRYEQFNTDIAHIQSTNKAIAYALGADTGAWDAGHSLRPVGSLNHKRGRVPVQVIRANDYEYNASNFEKVPVPEESYNLEQFQKDSNAIPNANKTLLRHGPWQDDDIKLLMEQRIPTGSRSAALTKLAYTLCEKGLDNTEVYSVIRWADKRWRKFYDRYNKEKYYVSLINYARQKVPYEGIKDVTVLADEIVTHTFKEVLNYVDETEWIINGLLPYKGVAYLVGRPGTGKTTLGLGMAAHLALNKKYLDWESSDEKKYKILYLSLEMSLEDVHQFFTSLKKNFTDKELADLDRNFHTYASPEKIKLYQPSSPLMGKFLRKLENMQPDVILVDSASYSLASNLSNQEEVTKSIEVLDQIKDRYGCTIIFIHHSRKEPPGHGYREADLDDVFGSAFIAASASSILSLKQNPGYSQENPLMDIRYLKSRFKGDNSGFSVSMDGERRIFVRPSAGAIEAPKENKEKKEKKQNGNSKSFFAL